MFAACLHCIPVLWILVAEKLWGNKFKGSSCLKIMPSRSVWNHFCHKLLLRRQAGRQMDPNCEKPISLKRQIKSQFSTLKNCFLNLTRVYTWNQLSVDTIQGSNCTVAFRFSRFQEGNKSWDCSWMILNVRARNHFEQMTSMIARNEQLMLDEMAT